MFDDLQDPKNSEPAGEPAPGAELSQPAGGSTPETPQPPQESPVPPQPRFNTGELLPRESDEGLGGPAEPRAAPTTGSLVERLTGALRMVTGPLRNTGYLRDTGMLNRTGSLRGEHARGSMEDARPGVTGDLRSIDTDAFGKEPYSPELPGSPKPTASPEPPYNGVTGVLRDLQAEDPIQPAPEPEEDSTLPPGAPRFDADYAVPRDEIPDLRQLDSEAEESKGERGSGSLIERLTGTLRMTTGALRQVTGPLRGTGSLRKTGPLGGRGAEGGSAEAGEAPQGEGQPGAEGAPGQPRQRATRTLRPSPEAYVPELRQTLASEDEQARGGRPSSGILKRITGTLRKVTGPLRGMTGPLRGTGSLRDTGGLRTGGLREEEPVQGSAGGPEGGLPADLSALPAVQIPDSEPEIADDFLSNRLGTASLIEADETSAAYSTGWEDISVPPAPDIDITSEMLAESERLAGTTEPDLLQETGEATFTGDEPISLLDSGAIAALGRAEEAEQEDYLPDWMAEIRQEAAAQEPAPPVTHRPFGTGSLGSAGEEKPRKKGVTGQLRDFIAGILGRSEEKRRPTGELPDDLVTGRLERSMTTAELSAPPETRPAEPTAAAPTEDFVLPEDRFTFGGAFGTSVGEAEAEAETGFDFGIGAEAQVESGQATGFTFGDAYEEEINPVRPLEVETEPADETEPVEAPFGGEWGKTRSLDDFELDLGDEGPLAARFGMFREQTPEDRVRPVEEIPTIEEAYGDEGLGTGQPAETNFAAGFDQDAGFDQTAGAGQVEYTEQEFEIGRIPGFGDAPIYEEAADTGLEPDAGGVTFDNQPTWGADAAQVEYKLSPEEEALLWGRAEHLQTRDLSSEEGLTEEIWAPTDPARRAGRPTGTGPVQGDEEDKGPIPDLADLNELTDLRDLSLEDRADRPQPPTGGLYMPVSADAYAAAFLAGIDLPETLEEGPKDDMLRKALTQTGEPGSEEEVVSIQDLRSIALEGYQETAAPRASLVEEAPVEVEAESAAEAQSETSAAKIAAAGTVVSTVDVDLAPARGFRPWLKQRNIVEQVLLVESVLVVLAMLVAVPFFIYTIVRGVTRPAAAQVTRISPRPLPAELPTPTGLVLPGGWYFDLNKSTFVEGKWIPARSEWLEGTELRRVIALPWNPQTEAVIQTFKAGDRVKLDLSNGKSLVYKISEVRRVPVTDNSVYTDSRPTMVVILYKENAQERWVVFCKP